MPDGVEFFANSPDLGEPDLLGNISGQIVLQAGDYRIDLRTVGAGSGISVSLTTIYGDISVAPEPATWIGIALGLLCLIARGATTSCIY